GRLHHLQQREALLLDFDLDVALLELTVLELLAQLLARTAAPLAGFGLRLGDLGLHVTLGRHHEEWALPSSRLLTPSSCRCRRGGRRGKRRQQQIEQPFFSAL